MDAKLNDAGTLEGHADFSFRGDLEYLLRASFRTVPVPQWKELGQRISFGSGFGGEVTGVTASSSEKTEEPFHFSYKYTRKEFGDWPNRRILAPEPVITLPAPSDEELLPQGPSYLGPLTDIQFTSQLELPPGYRPELPAAIHLKRDFAQFYASYDFKDGKLISERHLRTLMREVPSNEREEYKQFAKTVQDDYGVYIPLLSGSGSAQTTTSGANLAGLNYLQSLPDSSVVEATRLESEAREKVAQHDVQGAVSSLYRAVSADPKFTRAWVTLGGLLLMQKQTEAGVDAFHKAMAADPAQPSIPKALGFGLMAGSQFTDAVQVWHILASCGHAVDRSTDPAFELGIRILEGGRPREGGHSLKQPSGRRSARRLSERRRLPDGQCRFATAPRFDLREKSSARGRRGLAKNYAGRSQGRGPK